MTTFGSMALRGSGATDRVATDRVIVAFGGRGTRQFQRHFGSDQSVWRDGDWNGFVRIALAVLLDVRKRRGKYDILLAFSGIDAERRL